MGIDDQQRPFFTMELKRGQSLREILSGLRSGKHARDAYPREQRLSIFLRVCEAVAYAHSRHVLHLDLKPENIQVGPFGEVQVCDWGMGEIARGESEEHLSEVLLDPDLYGGQLEPGVKGTPGYIAPEQENSRAAKSVRNDIFSLGCLLYELSMLKKPAARHDHPPESPAVAAIVSKACAPDPGERYADVAAMRADVSRHLTGHSAGVEQAGFIRELRLFYRRNRVPCLITLYFTLFLLGTGAWFTLQLRQEVSRTAGALDQTQEALATAQAERVIAKEARDEAEEALAKYEREKQWSTALVGGESVLEGAMQLLDVHIMNEAISLTAIENAIKEMDKALAKDPPKSDPLWAQMAYALFLTQRFAEAESYYAIGEEGQSDLRAIIPEFAPLVGENGLLPADDFIRLTKRLAEFNLDRSPLVEKMAIYDNLKRKPPAERARITRTVLELSNPDWKEPVFDYDPGKNHLRIGGEGLRSLVRREKGNSGFPKLCLLRLLKIHSLDLGGDDFRDLTQLKGLKLLRLDLRRSTVTNLSSLGNIRSLRLLTVAPGQFSPRQLSVLRASVVVQERARP